MRSMPLLVDGRFRNPWPTREPEAIPGEAPPGNDPGHTGEFREFLEWRFGREARAYRRSARRPGWEPPRATPAILPAGDPGTALTWIGHSTWLLQTDGRAFLTDPIFGELPLIHRRGAPGIGIDGLRRLDALLVSHDHYDHLEDRTVRKLPRDLPVFCGLGVGAWFRKRGFTAVLEMTWWDRADLDGREVTFVPARHFSGRTLTGRDRTLWGGFVVRGRGSVDGGVYYAGDTGWSPAFAQVGAAFPDLAGAVLPIGAYTPRWFMGPVHVDPHEAVEAFLATGARTMACGHWGTFRLADEPMDEPPVLAREAASKRGVAERVWVPAVGETRVLD